MHDRDRQRTAAVWLAAAALSIAIHALCAYLLVAWDGGVRPVPEPPHHVVLLVPADRAPPAAEAADRMTSGESVGVSAPVPVRVRTARRRGTPVNAEPAPPVDRAPGATPAVDEKKTESAGADGAPIVVGAKGHADIWPSRDTLDRIAGTDPHVRHLEPPRPGEFIPPRRYTRDNLPPEIKHDEIGRRLTEYWSPTWDLVKDDAVASYSSRKAGTLLKDWYNGWQGSLSRRGLSADPEARLADADTFLGNDWHPHVSDTVTTPDAIVTLIEIAPMRDGRWAVRLLKPSGHRIYDRQLVAEAERAVASLDPWKEGFGWVMQFTLSTELTIVPPLPVVGLAFDIGALRADLIYPLKKILKKSIRFDGAANLMEQR